MNIYLTSGTEDFMILLRKKYPRETMVLMFGEGNSLLLHETGGKSVFQSPRRYEVIHSSGELKEAGYFAFNNIPVTDEGRPVFEHLFQNQMKQIDSEVGFIASRLLRPIKSDTFLVITQWTNATYFHRWQDTTAYGQIYGQLTNNVPGINSAQHLFSSSSYIRTFNANRLDEE